MMIKQKYVEQNIQKTMESIDTFKALCKHSQKSLKKLLYSEILPVFFEDEELTFEDGYIYAKGEIPIMLLAHMDTVFRKPPTLFIHDKENRLLTSPHGLGGDDRCGVYGIIALLLSGQKPHILFTEDEEIGGVGAGKAASKMKKPEGVKYLIQLDRRGTEDAVFYSCDNKDFHSYVEDFGFKKASGSFTDISTLMPTWDLCGVNLSIGYHNEHSKNEYVDLEAMEQTILKVSNMLNNPPEQEFEYIEKVYVKKKWSGRLSSWSNYYDELYKDELDRLDNHNINPTLPCNCCGGESSLVTSKYNLDLCSDCYDLLTEL